MIKEFRPVQQILLHYRVGGQLRAESFTVGQQGVVSIEAQPTGEVAVVRDDPRGGRQRIVYSAVGVCTYDEPTASAESAPTTATTADTIIAAAEKAGVLPTAPPVVVTHEVLGDPGAPLTASDFSQLDEKVAKAKKGGKR